MNILPYQAVLSSLHVLNRTGCDWLLLRNTSDAIPRNLPEGKDIDVLVRPDHAEAFDKAVRNAGFSEIPHPCRFDKRLYGVDPFRFYRNRDNILIDVAYKVSVRSLDKGQWIPLDSVIQQSIWVNSTQTVMEGIHVKTPGVEDAFTTLLAHSVFTKNNITAANERLLNELFLKSDASALEQRAEKVFFGFTPTVMRKCKEGNLAGLYEAYLAFADY